VDTYADSGGHDVCKLPPERWFEGLVPTEPAYPLHPNGKGEASMARSAIAQLSRPWQAGGGPDGPGPGAAGCLASRSSIGPANIGRIRLGYTRAALLRRVKVVPARRTRHTVRYCTKDRSGRVTTVFASRSRAARASMVMTTASGHGNRRVRVRSGARAFARAYPNRRRVAPGIFRASPGSERIFGIRRGRVAFVAVTRERVLTSRSRLLRNLRLALR
jgi:hypothetical protein